LVDIVEKVCCCGGRLLLIHLRSGESEGFVDDGRSAGDAQECLFYQFRLDDHAPADHLLRAVDRFVDLDPLVEQSFT
jgi:hypothetical protein